VAQPGTTLFFVVRTDISADSGVNPCFGTCDTQDKALLLMSDFQASMQGTFAIYPGDPLPPAEDPQVPA
jgi:hypothetical protein